MVIISRLESFIRRMSTLVPFIEAITFQSSGDPESRTVSFGAGLTFIVAVLTDGFPFDSIASEAR